MKPFTPVTKISFPVELMFISASNVVLGRWEAISGVVDNFLVVVVAADVIWKVVMAPFYVLHSVC